MCEIISEPKQLRSTHSPKSLIVWQSVGTFLQSAIQLMRVSHHYFSKITSVCLLLVLPCAAQWKEVQHRSKDPRTILWLPHGSAEMQLRWLDGLLDDSPGNFAPGLMNQNTCSVWEILGISPRITWQKCSNCRHLSLPEIFAIPLISFGLRSADEDPESFIVAESRSENRGAVCKAPLKTVLHNVNTITRIKL